MEYSSLLVSPSFFLFLLQIDRSIADACQANGCIHCGGRLSSSNWLRAGFGVPAGTSEEVLVRHSFVCSSCKRRTTPNSLRWMYYRWFSSPAQFLLPALRGGLSRSEMIEICAQLGVSPSRIRLWQRWWRDEFFPSAYWSLCGTQRFRGAVSTAENLLSAVSGVSGSIKSRVKDLLSFLSAYRTMRLWQSWPLVIERLWGLL